LEALFFPYSFFLIPAPSPIVHIKAFGFLGDQYQLRWALRTTSFFWWASLSRLRVPLFHGTSILPRRRNSIGRRLVFFPHWFFGSRLFCESALVFTAFGFLSEMFSVPVHLFYEAGEKYFLSFLVIGPPNFLPYIGRSADQGTATFASLPAFPQTAYPRSLSLFQHLLVLCPFLAVHLCEVRSPTVFSDSGAFLAWGPAVCSHSSSDLDTFSCFFPILRTFHPQGLLFPAEYPWTGVVTRECS